MAETIKFGDVFKYKEKEYVYLVKTDEILYVAAILNKEDTSRVNTRYENLERNGKIDQYKDHPLYCFVMLTTEEFKDRMANFYRPGHDESNLNFGGILCSLNVRDLKDIKSEILKGPVPKELQELVKNINI
ncbi:MAG: hypothetical protein Q8Q46_01430 [Candidatus Giovannonibacteria bacterium]|nr:hypothetical protein [Candidatus Giovannonibacteria bacterium]